MVSTRTQATPGRARRDPHREEGAALVEFTFVALLLVTILFGIAEFGLAFRDWLTVTSASRSGVRVGTAAGNDASSDFLVLKAVEAAMSTSDFTDVQQVLVFKATGAGDPITTGPSGTTNRYIRDNSSCGWQPCPDPTNALFGYGGGWLPADRNTTVSSGSELDLLGVRIVFDHTWVTNFIVGGTSTWTDDAVMRMEPQQFQP